MCGSRVEHSVVFVFVFQSIGISYKRVNPDSVVSVQGRDPRPMISIQPSEASNSFRRYGFVEAVQELDPSGTLGLLEPDYKMCFCGFLSSLILIFGALASAVISSYSSIFSDCLQDSV